MEEKELTTEQIEEVSEMSSILKEIEESEELLTSSINEKEEKSKELQTMAQETEVNRRRLREEMLYLKGQLDVLVNLKNKIKENS